MRIFFAIMFLCLAAFSLHVRASEIDACLTSYDTCDQSNSMTVTADQILLTENGCLYALIMNLSQSSLFIWRMVYISVFIFLTSTYALGCVHGVLRLFQQGSNHVPILIVIRIVIQTVVSFVISFYNVHVSVHSEIFDHEKI